MAQGEVATPAFSKHVLLQGRENMNRAVHGDIVVVEVFPEAEWSAPADEVVDQDCESRLKEVKGLTNTDPSNIERRRRRVFR